MKKIFFVLSLILPLALSGCNSKKENENNITVNEGIENNTFSTLSFAVPEAEYPRVDGNIGTLPLSVYLEHALTGKDLDTLKNSVLYRTNVDAFINLFQGASDFVISYGLDKEMQSFEEFNSSELYEIAQDALIVFTNAKNDIDDISSEDLQKIFANEIDNWKELGGKDEPIIYHENKDYGSSVIAEKFIFPDRALPEYNSDGTMAEDENASETPNKVETLAELTNDDLYISYTTYNYYTKIASEDSDVKILKVDGVSASDETILDKSYPFISGIYLIVHPNMVKESPTVKRIIDFFESEEGVNFVEEAGYISPKSEKLGNSKVSEKFYALPETIIESEFTKVYPMVNVEGKMAFLENTGRFITEFEYLDYHTLYPRGADHRDAHAYIGMRFDEKTNMLSSDLIYLDGTIEYLGDYQVYPDAFSRTEDSVLLLRENNKNTGFPITFKSYDFKTNKLTDVESPLEEYDIQFAIHDRLVLMTKGEQIKVHLANAEGEKLSDEFDGFNNVSGDGKYFAFYNNKDDSMIQTYLDKDGNDILKERGIEKDAQNLYALTDNALIYANPSKDATKVYSVNLGNSNKPTEFILEGALEDSLIIQNVTSTLVHVEFNIEEETTESDEPVSVGKVIFIDDNGEKAFFENGDAEYFDANTPRPSKNVTAVTITLDNGKKGFAVMDIVNEFVRCYDDKFKLLTSFNINEKYSLQLYDNILMGSYIEGEDEETVVTSGVIDMLNSKDDDIKYIIDLQDKYYAYLDSANEDIYYAVSPERYGKYSVSLVDAKTNKAVIDKGFANLQYFDNDMIFVDSASYTGYVNSDGEYKVILPKEFPLRAELSLGGYY